MGEKCNIIFIRLLMTGVNEQHSQMTALINRYE